MNNIQLKILSIILFILLIIFSIFKVNFNHENYFFISIIIIVFIGIFVFYFLRFDLKVQILAFLMFSYSAIFIIELNYYKIFYSVCNSYNCIKEEKKIIEKKINNKVKYSVLPKNFIYDDNIIYPLSLHSKTFVIGANENNYLPHFFTDRYGFINDDKFYDNKNIDFLIIGDSYAMGASVNYEDNLQGQLKKNNKSVISFGMGGNGPLLALASLVEYGGEIKPKNIIYIFCETNDLGHDLFLEKNNKILINYFNKNFRQNLIFKKDLVQKTLDNKHASIDRAMNFQKSNIFSYLKLSNLRYHIGIKNKGEKNIDEKYESNKNYSFNQALDDTTLNSNFFLFDLILKRMKESSVNSNFYIFYVPEVSNFMNKKKSNTYNAVKNIALNNNINFIDINEKLKFKEKKFLKSMYPENFQHPNEKGYKVWANIITNHVSK